MKAQIVETNAGRVRRSGCLLFTILVAVSLACVNLAKGDKSGAFAAQPICFKYNISCDSYRVIEDIVRQNQSLSKILAAFNVPYSKIHHVARKSKDVFDVRKMKAGNPYCIMSRPDLKNTARYFIYEKNPINYVVYDLSDPVDVYLGQKKVEIKLRIASGAIDSSLSQSFAQMGLNSDLTMHLAEIYAWTIDCHHLKKGDYFVIIFEENYVEDESFGLNKVVAAKFNHRAKDYYAFYFNRKGREGYYDENGNSLQKAFLKAPLRYTSITSRPSTGRLHPILKIRRPHLGTDYAAPHGTPIHTIGDGVVLKMRYHRALGKNVIIAHNGIYKSQYLHMSRFAKGIRPGVQVNRGDVIGYVGSTGLATGPHLEFRFWKKGKIYNHLDASDAAGESLAGDAARLFQRQIATLKSRLDTMPLNQKLLITKHQL